MRVAPTLAAPYSLGNNSPRLPRGELTHDEQGLPSAVTRAAYAKVAFPCAVPYSLGNNSPCLSRGELTHDEQGLPSAVTRAAYAKVASPRNGVYCHKTRGRHFHEGAITLSIML